MLTSRSNGGVSVTSAPWRRTRPAVGISNPAIIRSVVVLPDPDGPSIEKNSPSRTSRSMPSTATTSPNRLTTDSSRTAAAAVGTDATSVVGVGIAKWDLEVGLGGRSWGTAGRVAALCRAARWRVKVVGAPFRSARHRLRAVFPTRTVLALALLAAVAVTACDAGPPSPTPPIVPGASATPPRGQHHHQGLCVPARRAGPRARARRCCST